MITIFSRISQENSPKNYAAKVNDVEISFLQLDEATAEVLTFYAANEQTVDESTLRTNTLNNMIDQAIIAQYAQANEITVPDEDIQRVMSARIEQYGSGQKLSAEITRLYGISLERYTTNLRDDLLREKVQSSVNLPLSEWLASQRSTADIVWNI